MIFEQFNLVVVFVSESKEKDKTQSLKLIDVRLLDEAHHRLEVLILAISTTDDILLHLGNVIEISLVYKFSELLEHIEVLRCVSLTFLEFREVLNNSLHILDRAELCLALLVLQKALHQRSNRICHISKIVKHYLAEEFIIITREYDLLHLIRQMSEMLEINPIIFNTQELMYLSLVSPLIQKRRHRILSPVQDQDGGLACITSSAHLLNEQGILLDPLIDFLCKQLTYLRAVIISDLGILASSRHQD